MKTIFENLAIEEDVEINEVVYDPDFYGQILNIMFPFLNEKIDTIR